MATKPVKKESKPAAPKAAKVSAEPKQVKKSPVLSIIDAAEATFSKLKSLKLDTQLQEELEWCIGSYRADGNPVGLYQMCQRAIPSFKAALAKKTKGITAKFITDLEKVVQSR